MRRTRRLYLAEIAAVGLIVSLASPAFSGTAIRIDCTDGGGDLWQSEGHSILSTGFCDADHTCDGLCTFSFDPRCPFCLLAQFSRDVTCSPDGYQEACAPTPALPCPIGEPRVVLALGRKSQAHRRMHVRFGHHHVTLLLRCGYGPACTPPPAPPPPGIPDVGGDWTLDETTADGDCAPVEASYLKTPRDVRLAQDGAATLACLEPEQSGPDGYSQTARGGASDAALSVTTGTLSFLGEDASYEWTLTVPLPLPTDDGSVPASERWVLTRPSGLRADRDGTVTVCTKTATVAMSRVPLPPCGSDADCIVGDGCTRCDRATGRCVRAPRCQ